MSEFNSVFTITPEAERQVLNSVNPPSPRTGILKPLQSPSGKVNGNPNWKHPLENGNSPIEEKYIAKKQVRHSIVSTDSSVDLSRLSSFAISGRQRCRRKLSVYLHTHVVLIIVSSLAILDAVCVIGQLICDILIMKEKLDYFEEIDEDLTKELLIHLPHLNSSIHEKWNLHAILSVLEGKDIHTDDGPLDPPGASRHPGFARSLWNISTTSALFMTTPLDHQDNVSHSRHKRAVEPKVPGHEVDHGVLYELTHIFHLGSLAILSLLLLETLLKVVAMGKKLKHHKLEIFDALVVTISWGLDVGLLEGIWAHPGSEAATFLMYLLPWRVIRIVNSFVLVIQEKEHVHLKIVKQRLRQSLKKTKEALEKAGSYRHEVKALAGLCRKLGAVESEITACSPSGKAGRRGSVQSVLERAASLTFISTMSNMGSLPSLFDMVGSSSEEEEEDREEQNGIERGRGRKLRLQSAVSIDTLDSNSGKLDTEDNQAYENLAFENDVNRSRSATIEKGEGYEEKDPVIGKAEIERTDSNNRQQYAVIDLVGVPDRSGSQTDQGARQIGEQTDRGARQIGDSDRSASRQTGEADRSSSRQTGEVDIFGSEMSPNP